MRRPDQRGIIYKSVRMPKWSSANHSSIDCLVVFEHMPGEYPFTAAPYDLEPHGRELFQRLADGDFGEIAPFEADLTSAVAYAEAAAAFASFADTPAGAELLAEMADHNEEIASRSSRGIAVLAETHLSKRLVRLLQIAGVPESEVKRITFFEKIDMAEKTGSISHKERVALDIIRKIRNDIAHENGSFYTNKILDLTQRLHSCLEPYMTYLTVKSLEDQWIDLIFIDAYQLIYHSLKARADPSIQARIVS